jgi:hypothetical protein
VQGKEGGQGVVVSGCSMAHGAMGSGMSNGDVSSVRRRGFDRGYWVDGGLMTKVRAG